MGFHEDNLMTVHTKRTEKDRTTESVEEFLLTREGIIRFVQDSFASAVDRQKRNADKNGRKHFYSFESND